MDSLLKNAETLKLSPSRGQRVRILLGLFHKNRQLQPSTKIIIKPRKELKEVHTRDAFY